MKSNFFRAALIMFKSLFSKLKSNNKKINTSITDFISLENKHVTVEANPVYIPRKHTVESYRSQQRKAKQKRKSKNR